MAEQGDITIRTISIIGGTGREGKGLAYRWAKAGYHVIIGSRQAEKAVTAAHDLAEILPAASRVEGAENLAAARQADIVVVTVPYAAHCDTMTLIAPAVQGKIVIDVTVPLAPPKVTKVQMPPAGSAAQEAQEILGSEVQVTAAFHSISYEHLMKDEPVECDVLVTGSGKSARTVTLTLVDAAGLTGWDAGPIENTVVVEGMTSVLIGLNKQYGVESAGIKITGIPRSDRPK